MLVPLTHYQLVTMARKHKKSACDILERIAERIHAQEMAEIKEYQISLSARFRMLEELALGNAIMRTAKRYQQK